MRGKLIRNLPNWFFKVPSRPLAPLARAPSTPAVASNTALSVCSASTATLAAKNAPSASTNAATTAMNVPTASDITHPTPTSPSTPAVASNTALNVCSASGAPSASSTPVTASTYSCLDMLSTFDEQVDAAAAINAMKVSSTRSPIAADTTTNVRHALPTTAITGNKTLGILAEFNEAMGALAPATKRAPRIRLKDVSAPSNTAVCPPTTVYKAVSSVFATVTQSDVRQCGGQQHLNAGEITMASLTKIIDVIGDISPQDVFLDVGSGVGNVVAQMALATTARFSIGIEIRGDVANLSTELLRAAKLKWPRLEATELLSATS